jgi:phospholipase/carboxylesterase
LRPQPDFIHEFVPDSGSRTLLLLHGTGGNERDLIPLGRELDPNASLLSPRGKVLENGMPRFFRRLAEGVFDLEDLKKRTHELADFVVAAAQLYEFDLKKIVAVGYSNGANIAASILLLRPETFAAAILFRAMVPFVPDIQPDLSFRPRLDRCGIDRSHRSRIGDKTVGRAFAQRGGGRCDSIFSRRPWINTGGCRSCAGVVAGVRCSNDSGRTGRRTVLSRHRKRRFSETG